MAQLWKDKVFTAEELLELTGLTTNDLEREVGALTGKPEDLFYEEWLSKREAIQPWKNESGPRTVNGALDAEVFREEAHKVLILKPFKEANAPWTPADSADWIGLVAKSRLKAYYKKRPRPEYYGQVTFQL